MQPTANPAQKALLDSVRQMPKARFHELVAMAVDLARLDAEQNLRVRTQQHLSQMIENRAETSDSEEEKTDCRPAGLPPVQPNWEITEKWQNVGPAAYSILRKYHVLQLFGAPGAPYFELNNTSDDEATQVDLIVHVLGEAKPSQQNIHARHMHRYDKTTALEAIDQAIEQYALPRLEGEIRNAVDAITNLK